MGCRIIQTWVHGTGYRVEPRKVSLRLQSCSPAEVRKAPGQSGGKGGERGTEWRQRWCPRAPSKAGTWDATNRTLVIANTHDSFSALGSNTSVTLGASLPPMESWRVCREAADALRSKPSNGVRALLLQPRCSSLAVLCTLCLEPSSSHFLLDAGHRSPYQKSLSLTAPLLSSISTNDSLSMICLFVLLAFSFGSTGV